MAKQIKAIKCPHCGSVNKTNLDKDLYHCENCNTDYYLDNDDININIHNKTTVENRYDVHSLLKNRILLIGIACLVGFILVLAILTSLLNRPQPPKYGTYASSTSSSPQTVTAPITANKPVEPIKVEPKAIHYLPQNKVYYTYLANDGQFYSFSLDYRAFDSHQNALNDIYYEIRDALTGKLVKSDKLAIKNNNDNWYFRRFDNGVTYIVYDDSKVYAYDENRFELTDVSKSLFNDYPEFVSGIATVNLTPWGYEDSFYILTNNGQEYFFYPLLNKIYNYKSDYDELRKYASELNNKREKVAEPYIRTSYCFEKLNDNVVLVKVVHKTTNISRFDRFGFSSINNSDKPYKINLQYGEGPIIEDKILAKDRLFFSPSVVYSTEDKLIIRVKNNASPKSYYNLQSLDVNTGEVDWTIEGNQEWDFWSASSSDGTLSVWNKYNLDLRKLFIPYADGYLVQLDYGHYVVISKQGEIRKEVKYQLEPIFAKAAS
ncbi:hypothetical protein GCM10023211_10540 [Orbus sasakiae]|uniref:Uncharacterized protein n=1 Tax=Orbus sasakiae TaxID=1078475 RepID=A0ABP9N9F8_9GAMM